MLEVQDYTYIIQIDNKHKYMLYGPCSLLIAGCRSHSSISQPVFSEVNTTDTSLECVSCSLISNIITKGIHLQTFYAHICFHDSCMISACETPI